MCLTKIENLEKAIRPLFAELVTKTYHDFYRKTYKSRVPYPQKLNLYMYKFQRSMSKPLKIT